MNMRDYPPLHLDTNYCILLWVNTDFSLFFCLSIFALQGKMLM